MTTRIGWVARRRNDFQTKEADLRQNLLLKFYKYFSDEISRLWSFFKGHTQLILDCRLAEDSGASVNVMKVGEIKPWITGRNADFYEIKRGIHVSDSDHSIKWGRRIYYKTISNHPFIELEILFGFSLGEGGAFDVEVFEHPPQINFDVFQQASIPVVYNVTNKGFRVRFEKTGFSTYEKSSFSPDFSFWIKGEAKPLYRSEKIMDQIRRLIVYVGITQSAYTAVTKVAVFFGISILTGHDLVVIPLASLGAILSKIHHQPES